MKLRIVLKLALIVCALASMASSLGCIQECRQTEIGCFNAGGSIAFCEAQAQKCAQSCPR